MLSHFGRTNFFYPRLFAFAVDLGIAVGLSLFPRIGWIFGLIYFLFKDSMPFNKGHSYGRRLFKIKLVSKVDGQLLINAPEKSLIRQIVLLIPLLNLYEVYLFFFENVRFGEQWSETTVVRAEDL